MPFQIERKQNLSLFLCLYLSLVLKEAQGHLRDMSFTSFFDPEATNESWLAWLNATLGVPNMRNVVLSPKRIQSIFTEGLACVYITESFSYMLLF